jgi:hypothetical protein
MSACPEISFFAQKREKYVNRGMPHFGISVKLQIFYTHIDLFEKKVGPDLMNLSLFWAQKLISGQEDMKIKKNVFSTLVLEFFCQSKFSCSKNPKFYFLYCTVFVFF